MQPDSGVVKHYRAFWKGELAGRLRGQKNCGLEDLGVRKISYGATT